MSVGKWNGANPLEVILAETKAKLEAAEAWKAEQLAVESTWDAQAVAKELGIGAGRSIRPNILPKIQELNSKLAKAVAALEENSEVLPDVLVTVNELRCFSTRMYEALPASVEAIKAAINKTESSLRDIRGGKDV